MNDSQSRNRRGDQGKLVVGPAKLPSLPAIRAFEAAARLGSFAKAAQELDTTSASVSYHVRRLEQQIGVKLFLRHSQHVELTAPGRLAAEEVMSAFATLRAGFSKARDVDECHLAVTTLPTLGTTWLTPRLGRFRKLHPQIAVELDLSETARDLGATRYDLAIRNGHGHWPGLRAIRLFQSIFMPLCAPHLKAAAAGIADPDSPSSLPLLGRPDWWVLWYRGLGHKHAAIEGRFGTRLPTEHLDMAAAMAGHGIAIGSPILFGDEIRAGRLVPAHDFVAGDGRAFWIAYPAVMESHTKIVRFREWLCGEAAEATDAAYRYVQHAVTVPTED
ncbi:MAG TPA: LysR substrate-binding domain-containing protein [Gammaproteobacteria bacterium]|nr:LysR substrate-binding domain-containing protein [Gammaproteobacteria bacterium]